MKFLALDRPCACLVLGLALLACHSSPGKTSARSIPTHTGKLPDATRYFGTERTVYVSSVVLSPTCRKTLHAQADRLGVGRERVEALTEDLALYLEDHLYDIASNTPGFTVLEGGAFGEDENAVWAEAEIHDLGVWIDRSPEVDLVQSVLEETRGGEGSFWCVLTLRLSAGEVRLGIERTEGIYLQHGMRAGGEADAARPSTDFYPILAAASAAAENAWGELLRRLDSAVED